MNKRILWPHQREALRYAMQAQHPAIFMEMRLGKCAVAIRRISMYKPRNAAAGRKVLIVCPSSAMIGWEEELAAEGSTVAFLTGTRKDRLARLVQWKDDGEEWYIINREGHRALPEIGDVGVVQWDAVVLDESHSIKNPKAKITRFFLKSFRDVPHRWCLTGTPRPESNLDLWCQMAFLHGEWLGYHNYWDFRAKACEPKGYEWVQTPETKLKIVASLRRQVFTKRLSWVHTEQKITEKRYVEFPATIRALYQKIEDEWLITEDITTKWAVGRYTWLRQLCGGFADGELLWDGKCRELLRLLQDELKGTPVVVWFNFNAELFHAQDVLEEAGIGCSILHGGIPQEARKQARARFMYGNTQVVLLQQAVGQMGLDLSRADTAIYFSEPTSLLGSMQTHQRIVNLRKRRPLLFLYLLVRNSIDEDVRAALAIKRIKSIQILERIRQHTERRCGAKAKEIVPI